MPRVLRLGRIELKVFDLEKAVDYYTNIIGLQETGRKGNSVYFKAWDEFDHHSLILTKENSAGIGHVAFKVDSVDDLAYYEKQIEKFGLTTSRSSNSERLAEGEAVRFILPTGQPCELYHDIEFIGTAVGNINPMPWPLEQKGISPHRLDHCLLAGDEIVTTTRFFVDVLDFKQSERIVLNNGEMIASFLFSSNKAHDIALIKGPQGKLHHVGFEAEDMTHVFKAADILAMYKVPFDVTPTRHGVTRGKTIYFYDPSGNRNEIYTGGNIAFRDMPVITWTEDEIGQGVFFHSRELNESFLNGFT